MTEDGKVEFRKLGDGRRSQWSGCRSVICGGPTLVRKGKIALAPKSEGFRDPGVFMRKRRAAVGLTEHNKLLFVTVDKPIHLTDLAKLMLHLGATDAVDMDGGSSTALYCHGKVISRPGRSLTNLLVLYDSPEQYASYRSQLAPNMPAPAGLLASRKPAQSVIASDGPLLDSLASGHSTAPVLDLIRWDAYRPTAPGYGNRQTIGSRPR